MRILQGNFVFASRLPIDYLWNQSESLLGRVRSRRIDRMAGGVQSFLKTAYTCAAKLREDGDPRIETQMTACQAAINKALSTYGKKKVKAKASLKKLDDALDQVKKCLDAVPAPDTKGALAAIQQARTAAVATETVAVKTG